MDDRFKEFVYDTMDKLMAEGLTKEDAALAIVNVVRAEYQGAREMDAIGRSIYPEGGKLPSGGLSDEEIHRLLKESQKACILHGLPGIEPDVTPSAVALKEAANRFSNAVLMSSINRPKACTVHKLPGTEPGADYFKVYKGFVRLRETGKVLLEHWRELLRTGLLEDILYHNEVEDVYKHMDKLEEALELSDEERHQVDSKTWIE